MALQSQLFRSDPKLEAAAVSDPAHILLGASGPHVGKIQQALIRLDGAAIAQDSVFGPATAAAVTAFKQKRQILNPQGKIDNIVGRKTIAAMDGEMLAKEKAGGGGSRRGFVGSAVTTVNHTLIYFSGAPDNRRLEGLPLLGPDMESVQKEMENIRVVNAEKFVLGFGGSRTNPAGLLAALAFIIGSHDPRGKLIIYGYSVGAINALQLCRVLDGVITPNVNLLITVDVVNDPHKPPPEFGFVPPNVDLNRNYFQIDDSLVWKGQSGIRTSGRRVVAIDCSNDSFELGRRSQHGQMERVTHLRTIADMRKVMNS